MSGRVSSGSSAGTSAAEAWVHVMKDMLDASPMNVFNQMMEQNMSMWNNFAPSSANKKPQDDKPEE